MQKLCKMLVEACESGESIKVSIKAKACIMLEATVGIIKVQSLRNTIIIITDSDVIPTITLNRCKGLKYNTNKKCFKCSIKGIKVRLNFL